MKSKKIISFLVPMFVFAFAFSLTGCGKEDNVSSTQVDNPTTTTETHKHAWGTPTYTWSDDYETCTAERVCLNDATHIETETANSSYDVITPATYTSKGLGRYTVTFENAAFTTQTMDIDLDELKYNRVENKIYFGTYPQSLVSDDTIIASLNTKAGDHGTESWTDYNYYVSSSVTSFMYYQDIDYDNNGTYDYRGVYFTQHRPYFYTNSSSAGNTYQDDNGYSANTVYWFSYDPIEWDILTESSGKALIIANLILDSQDYYPSSSTSSFSHNGGTGYATNYELSNIRKFLNENFYNTAFNNLQKGIIDTTEVDNSASSTGKSTNIFACNNTNDKVFLLSYVEATTYYASESARQANGTDYAKCQGLYVRTSGSYVGTSFWWLRSPRSDNAHYTCSASVDDGSMYVYCNMYGVRPACWINL